MKQELEKEGWIFEDYRCFKKFGDVEIDIEFCIGDFCVGAYDQDLSLLEPKNRVKGHFLEALIAAMELAKKYS